MTEGTGSDASAKDRRVDAGWLQTLIVIAALGGFMFLLNSQIADVRRAVDNVRGDLGKLGERVARVETRLDGVEARLDGVEASLAGVEARLVGVESELDGIKIRLGSLPAEAKAAKASPVLMQMH